MSDLRQYETTYILRPDADAETKTKVQDRVAQIITEQFGGEILRVDEWGRRELAYPVKKFLNGYYVYVRYAATADTIAELERILRLLDSVIKFLTVRLEREEQNSTASPNNPGGVSVDDDEDDDDDDE